MTSDLSVLRRAAEIARSLRCPCGRLGCDMAGVREHTDPAWRSLVTELVEQVGDQTVARGERAEDEVVVRPGPKPMAIAVMVSQEERDHIDVLRRQSYELAVERGHLRRG